MSSWVDEAAESRAGFVCDYENSREEAIAKLREVLVDAIEEAARRVRDTDEERGKGDTYYAQLGDAAATREACAKEIEAMLTDETQRGGRR